RSTGCGSLFRCGGRLLVLVVLLLFAILLGCRCRRLQFLIFLLLNLPLVVLLLFRVALLFSDHLLLRFELLLGTASVVLRRGVGVRRCRRGCGWLRGGRGWRSGSGARPGRGRSA